MEGEEDPFGMAPPLSDAAAPPLDGDGGLPTFGDVAPPPDMPPMDMGGMDMGGMDMGGGLPTFGDAPAPPPDMGMMGGMGGMDMGGGGMDMGGMSMPPMGGGLGDEFSTPGELGPIAKWRIEQSERVSEKQAAAATAEAAKIAEAQAALTEFYAERADKVSKRAAENRTAEAQYVEERDAAMIADSWESVCKLVDLKEKAGADVDMSRMRSLLTQLKHVA